MEAGDNKYFISQTITEKTKVIQKGKEQITKVLLNVQLLKYIKYAHI